MTLLEPGDEVLPKDILRNERSEEAKPWDLIGNSKYIFLVLACLIAILVISKLYLRYSWILPSSPQSKVQRFYTSILSALHDLGYVRNQGETRVEYRERLQREYGLDTLSLTKLQQKLAYSLTATQNISAQTLQEVRDTFNRDMSSILKLPISARIKLWISPTAAIQFISRYKW